MGPKAFGRRETAWAAWPDSGHAEYVVEYNELVSQAALWLRDFNIRAGMLQIVSKLTFLVVQLFRRSPSQRMRS